MGNHAAGIAGIPLDQYCQSGELMARAQIKAWDEYGQDVVIAQSDNYYIAEGFGITVEHHDNGLPTLKEPAVQSLGQVSRLRVPDPQTDGRMPVYLDAIRRLKVRFGDQVAIRSPGTGPFSLASHLMGTERLLLELADADQEPGGAAEQALLELLGLTTAALTRFAKACLEAGADMVVAGDSLASIDVISPAMYQKWAWPFERKFFDEIDPVARQCGATTLLHICGNTTPVLDLMSQTGARILELDSKVDLKVAKQKIGKRVCLLGNLSPVEVLLQGTPASTERAAREAIAAAGGGGGFILGSGCEVPVNASRENIRVIVGVARSTGRKTH